MITTANLNYIEDKVNGGWRPVPLGQYPGEKSEGWELPEDIQSEYARLNSMIETKYSREYLKICAFYNKLFPSLRSSGYITSTYNVPPFTALDQERSDTGTGISNNYLKQIVDQVVARIGTINFEPKLIADVPTLEYIIYKDEVERYIRKVVRDKKLVAMCTDVFHDAAIVGYSHVFIDPVLGIPIKANDYEIGMFESQFTRDDVKQMLYRNYSFPVTGLVPYLKHCDEETQKAIVEDTEGKDWVDFKMFFDCPGKRVVITIGGKTLPDVPYPFEQVQMVTFGWDVGFSKVTCTSLFDLLYPTQREVNRVMAKIQQLIRMYKGSVPVFNSDIDLSMKAITNGSGECLYVDSTRPIDSLMTVINPTPLDAQLNATKTELKVDMYELAGLQQISFDMENFRSAAAVIAADQFHDTVFQAQMSGMARFVADLFRTQVYYLSVVEGGHWADVYKLISDAEIELKPVVVTNPLGNKGEAEQTDPDYKQMGVAAAILNVMKNKVTYAELPFYMDKNVCKVIAAVTIVKLDALGIEVPDSLTQFMVDGFIDDIVTGAVTL